MARPRGFGEAMAGDVTAEDMVVAIVAIPQYGEWRAVP
jgi:hypothetical protein